MVCEGQKRKKAYVYWFSCNFLSKFPSHTKERYKLSAPTVYGTAMVQGYIICTLYTYSVQYSSRDIFYKNKSFHNGILVVLVSVAKTESRGAKLFSAGAGACRADVFLLELEHAELMFFCWSWSMQSRCVWLLWLFTENSCS